MKSILKKLKNRRRAMRLKYIISIILLAIMFSGCAYNDGIVQKDNIAYLKLTGNIANISLQIDDNEIIPLIELDEDTIFEIEPGVHIVKVLRNNQIIVNRELFFDNNITKEVNVK